MIKTFDTFEQVPSIVGGLLAACLGLDFVEQHCYKIGDCCELVAVRPKEITQDFEDCKPNFYRFELIADILVGCEQQNYLDVIDDIYCCLKELKPKLEIVSLTPVCSEKCNGWRLEFYVWVRPSSV